MDDLLAELNELMGQGEDLAISRMVAENSRSDTISPYLPCRMDSLLDEEESNVPAGCPTMTRDDREGESTEISRFPDALNAIKLRSK